jgi:hypothetical protein
LILPNCTHNPIKNFNNLPCGLIELKFSIDDFTDISNLPNDLAYIGFTGSSDAREKISEKYSNKTRFLE